MAEPTAMRVELVSPEKILFSGEATMVLVRTLGGGDIAFMPGHAPFLAALTEHAAKLHLADGSVMNVAVHGGFVEVSNNKVSILSDVAELSTQIDVARAQRAQAAAEARAAGDDDAAAALRRAKVRLTVAGAPAHAGSAAGH
ncbi:MAG: F0F1 ATP synthase subunit epsilon [Acidimicrobiia bacterium]